MKATGVFFLYLLGCLALGALLSYPLKATGWIDQAPHRVMGRLTQVFILAGLWPLLKVMRLDSRAALGYGAAQDRFIQALWRGWLLGITILAVLALTELLLGVRVAAVARGGWEGLVSKSLQALIGGILVGFLEETFFRGALFTAIRRKGSLAAAVLWTSGLYALLHFLKPSSLPHGVAFDWAGSWQMFTGVFTGAFHLSNLDSMTALVLVGVFLALVRERTGHIGWCIGLHAGWVFVIQVTRYLTNGDSASPYAFLVGSYDGMIGWLAAGWIGLLAVAFLLFGLEHGGMLGERDWQAGATPAQRADAYGCRGANWFARKLNPLPWKERSTTTKCKGKQGRTGDSP
jgi:membrane protease YdiL (CAAX protease family)